jgi:hypothetical protein
MANKMFELIGNNDQTQIRKILVEHPNLANEGVACNDNIFSKKGHPLPGYVMLYLRRKSLMNKLLKLQRYF